MYRGTLNAISCINKAAEQIEGVGGCIGEKRGNFVQRLDKSRQECIQGHRKESYDHDQGVKDELQEDREGYQKVRHRKDSEV